ncbi:hypothetical protein CUJ84_Chr002170 [Rhizobium leguminosarum]|uniref:Uncharacterized protein n=1 Tax=Rhizobium leguminosarum TaxID=384 RepID=A0A2K9Z2S9_RHILE|nr:hypothetical protein CUJ84_Chr002170 [Rhizobium leguminosarum]
MLAGPPASTVTCLLTHWTGAISIVRDRGTPTSPGGKALEQLLPWNWKPKALNDRAA